MTKKEDIQAIIDGVSQIWGVELIDSVRSRYIWTAKLMKQYSDEEIIGGAEWLKKHSKPLTISQLYFAMPRYLHDKKVEENKRRWQFE
jgi:hypothetical protein